ncbi:MAG: Rpn family recombination-promoting nuclease/putative transposase [Clostridiales bacterium]|nr:Rpn family recombination-promoting nuclease/putative transposase [Clostridiales bacterium]
MFGKADTVDKAEKADIVLQGINDTVLDYGGQPYRNVKDSVFKWLFADKVYLLQLYQALHPDDKETTVDDLDLVTLETVIIKDIHNDLGFSVGSKLIILAEAQSTWSVNIIVRSLFYLAHTYQNYLRKKNQSLYNTRPVSLPASELYVIYTGNAEINQKMISLSEEFFHGVSSAVEVKVKVITNGGGNDIINQYIMFSKVVDEQFSLHGRTTAAIQTAIRICKDQNILREFLTCHEKETIDIMVELYSQKEAVDDWGNSRYAEGCEEGREEGREEGKISATMANIRGLMNSMKFTADQAMQALGISAADQKKYRSLL